jgi:hypothetical protein
MKHAYKILVENPERKRSLLRPRFRWKDNNKMNLVVTGFEDVDWVHLVQSLLE